MLGLAQQHQIEVGTPALDRFFIPAPPRRLEGDEALSSLQAALSDEDEEQRRAALDPTLLPQRIMVMWRLARAYARIVGICAEDESLDSATEMQPNPWSHPVRPKTDAHATQTLLRKKSASDLIVIASVGIPLLPPRDAALAQRWCSVMMDLARELGVARSAGGALGMQGLLHPKTCAMTGVTQSQVLALEELLIDEAQRLIIECGERPAVEHFRGEFDFTKREAISLIRLARADALTTGSSSIEEDRAIMVANLKDLIARAKEEMNSDRELKALKQLAMIQGLTRTEPEDMARDFMRVIAAVATKQDSAQMLVPAGAQALLAEYSVLKDDHEEEEVEVFDQENVSNGK